jgi:hypothetical protein
VHVDDGCSVNSQKVAWTEFTLQSGQRFLGSLIVSAGAPTCSRASLPSASIQSISPVFTNRIRPFPIGAKVERSQHSLAHCHPRRPSFGFMCARRHPTRAGHSMYRWVHFRLSESLRLLPSKNRRVRKARTLRYPFNLISKINDLPQPAMSLCVPSPQCGADWGSEEDQRPLPDGLL